MENPKTELSSETNMSRNTNQKHLAFKVENWSRSESAEEEGECPLVSSCMVGIAGSSSNDWITVPADIIKMEKKLI